MPFQVRMVPVMSGSYGITEELHAFVVSIFAVYVCVCVLELVI